MTDEDLKLEILHRWRICYGRYMTVDSWVDTCTVIFYHSMVYFTLHD